MNVELRTTMDWICEQTLSPACT